MSSYKTAEEMAKIIKDIYETNFGGKKRGRFQISRSMFRRMAGRANLRDAFIQEVADESSDLGYILIPVGDMLMVIEQRVMDNYRRVTKSLVARYCTDNDIYEDGDKDEDGE